MNNYAIKGGVSYAHIESIVSYESCYFENNFAEEGGVAMVNDDGTTTFNDCAFTNNSAFTGSIVYLINSMGQSEFTNS